MDSTNRPVQFDIRLVSRSFDSCHSCLLRSCTFSYTTHRTVRSRTEKADAMTFVSQFDPQTSSWFDRPAVKFNRSNSIDRRDLVMAFPPSTMSNSIDSQISFPSASPLPVNNVELHRPTVRSPVQSNFFSTRPRKFARQQCRTPSTAVLPSQW